MLYGNVAVAYSDQYGMDVGAFMIAVLLFHGAIPKAACRFDFFDICKGTNVIISMLVICNVYLPSCNAHPAMVCLGAH
jgi:hypothetical protein